MGMIIDGFVIGLVIILMILNFGIGYFIGRRKGAKDGIDYCFDRWEEKTKADKEKVDE